MDTVPETISVVVLLEVNHASDDGDKDLGGDGGPRRSSGDGESAAAAAEAEAGEENKEDEEEIVKERGSCVSECSEEVVDLERGMAHLSKSERGCRICQMSLDAGDQESGIPIELGCSCKDDLAAAHKQCAETWFKIKGNKICEICGSIAGNVAGATETESAERCDEGNQATGESAQPNETDPRGFWQGHRFLNFLLACMVFAFIISWLFHFDVPS